MARSTILTVSPDLDLDKGFAQIEAERLAQTQGAQRFGTDMDSRLQGIYGQLTGALEQGRQTTGTIYNNSSNQIANAYQGAGATAAGASQQVQGRLSEMAQRLGLDPRALAEVSGRLGEQAMGHQLRNQTSMADRMASNAQLGAGMTAVSQFAINAAEQAKAQGRQDLARKVTSEIQRANTLAAASKTDFTAVKANQAARAAASAEAEARRAMAELAREARANQRAAASEARANQRHAQSMAERAARESKSGKKWDPLELFMAKAAFSESRQQPDPGDVVWNDYMAQQFGPKATQYVEERLAGDRSASDLKGFKENLNTQLLEKYVQGLKGTRRR